jgi:hypothetical protein
MSVNPFFFGIFIATKTTVVATSYGDIGNMDSKDSIAAAASDSIAAAAADYWLQTVLEDRAESAPPPAATETGAER